MFKVNYIERCEVRDKDIILPVDPKDILQGLQRDEVYILKNVFPKEDVIRSYRTVFDTMRREEPRVIPLQWGMPDFWRKDENPVKSSIPKMQAIYFNCFWNDGVPEPLRFGTLLGRLRNRIAGLPVEFGFRKDDGYMAIPVTQHYPKGGGFMAQHRDPPEPQRCVVSLTLTGFGKDFHQGGLALESADQTLLVDELLEIGDISIMRPDIPHAVLPVDPAGELDFNSLSGRWRFTTILVPPDNAPRKDAY
ncbi:MAG: hypothetical protein HY543_02180 [Deltaproteobacteria bacterium]|nr:hypothetical protein [Deltaproteobacteria bacterium]